MKVEKYIDTLDGILLFFPEAATALDEILIVLFKKHIEDVRPVLEGDNVNRVIRMFEMIDVVDEPGIDTIIWTALREATFAMPVLTIMREWDTVGEGEITTLDVLVALMKELALYKIQKHLEIKE